MIRKWAKKVKDIERLKALIGPNSPFVCRFEHSHRSLSLKEKPEHVWDLVAMG